MGGVVIRSPKFVESTDARSIWDALIKCYPEMERMKSIVVNSGGNKVGFIVCHEDSVHANTQVFHALGEAMAPLVVFNVPCFGHRCSNVADDTMKRFRGRSDLDVINPMHCTRKLMQQPRPRQALTKAVEEQGKRARIFVGVPPPEDGLKYSAELFDWAVLRSTKRVFLPEVWRPRFLDSREVLAVRSAQIRKILNGDYRSDVPEHYCWDPDTMTPCCRTVEEAKGKVSLCMSRMVDHFFGERLGSSSVMSWGESLRSASTFGTVGSVHACLRKGTRTWAKRAHEEDVSDEERADDAFPVRTLKRRKNRTCSSKTRMPRTIC